MEADAVAIKEIFKEITPSDNEAGLILSFTKKHNVKKGDILINPGEIVDSQYYILKGCLRTFYRDKKGKQYTLQFGVEDCWISDFMAYFNDQKSILTLETLEPSVLFSIKKENMEILLRRIPKLNQFFRKRLEGTVIEQQKRILFTISKPVKERYLDFLVSYPNLEKRLKNYHIASYLGITTESISRIRKEIGQQILY